VSLIEWTAIISTVAGISATLFILIQIRHMDKHRDLEASMKLFEWAQSDRLRKAFRWVEEEFHYENSGQQAKTKGDFETNDYPYEVTGYFELVGFLVEKKFIDLHVIDDRIGPHIMSNWKKLEPWIIAHRKEKNDDTFGEHFQKLYLRTTAYMRNRKWRASLDSSQKRPEAAEDDKN
jgi:hypothetical protein